MQQSQSSPFPLPSVYGVYAISGGQLYELEALAGRVPDQRVFMSIPIKTPSRTVLADGQIVFISIAAMWRAARLSVSRFA
jgi:hypothetical protein